VATSTTIIVLSPVALMPGLNGQLFRPLALAVTFAMLTSFCLSRTFVPMLCAHFLPDAHRLGAAPVRPRRTVFTRAHEGIEAVLSRLNRSYEWLLAVALRFRLLVLVAVLLLFAASLLQLANIGQEFFPASDAGQLVIYTRAPSGTNIEANERRIIGLEEFLKKHIPESDLQLIISEIGVDTDFSAAYTANAATWDATVRVQFKEERTRTAQDYAKLLRRLLQQDPDYADMRFCFNTGGMIQSTLNFGALTPIDVRVSGGNDTEAYTTAQAIRDRLSRIPGTADTYVLQRNDAPQKVIEVDRQRAAIVGLSETDIVNQVTAAVNSSQYVKRIIWIDRRTGQQYWIAVQYPQDSSRTLADMLDIVATGANSSTPVKLSSLIRITENAVPVESNHEEFSRVYNVLMNIEDRDVGGVVRDVQRELAAMRAEKLIPDPIRFEVAGEYTNMLEAFKTIGLGLLLATIFVYFLLVGLFRSFRGPLIIMVTVPMGLIGVLTILNLTGTTLNVESGMGVIFLVGIAVSNGVLLVDFANRRRLEGLSVRDAIESAAATRFRPILMTFLATFLDLTPMALGSSLADSTVPLARAVVGGMLTSTTLTLFVVPVLYSLLLRDGPIQNLDAEVEEEMTRPFTPIANPEGAAD
jgi:multidrug efflux pump subunit AcrB